MTDWYLLITDAVKKHRTPFYLYYWPKVLSAVKELDVLNSNLNIRHWLSFKTSPVAPLVRKWLGLGYGVEVVSDYELQAVLSEGFSTDRILVNGVAKHSWLNRCNLSGLNVVFDSLNELKELISQATENKWNLGLRVHVANEMDPDDPKYSTQFGMLPQEIIEAANIIKKYGNEVNILHFHLRSNIYSVEDYKEAINELSILSKLAELKPQVLDCGGGLPVMGEHTIGQSINISKFDLIELREIFKMIPSLFPTVKEVWLENGRFITARSAILVLQVLDVKDRPDSRYLICDGGRTNHALVSDWEYHDFFVYPYRDGPTTMTTICGPTCMAFDRILRTEISNSVQPGDYIIWMNAGSYHIPWETRFSSGYATVLWADENDSIKIARRKEPFEMWWKQWL